MDLFNRRKCRDLENMLEQEKQTTKELTAKLMGERVCGGYCFACENDIAGIVPLCGSSYTQHYCKLNCNCGSFVEKRPLPQPPKEDCENA